jgi:hypothetical protein
MSQHQTEAQLHSDNYQMNPATWNTGRNILVFAVLVSLVGCVAGYMTDPARFFNSYLVAFVYTSAIGIASLFFVQVQYLSGSAWSVTMRRIMENILFTLPFGMLLFVPVIFGLKYIYPWTDAALVKASQELQSKSGFLSENFFVVRTYIYFVLWSIWALAIYSQSIKQDRTHSVQQMYAISRWSAPGLFLAVVVGSLASFDWLMSVEPAWYSTIFGLYYLADGALAFFAVVTLMALGFRRAGMLKHSIHNEHYHDLGKWLFAMTAFYTYIAYSQYMLIWYANLPEETIFYRHRMVGSWLPLSLALPILRFFIPFFALLCRPAKRRTGLIGFFAVYSLIVVYLDFFWVVMPVHSPQGITVSWIDFAALGATVSVCGLAFWSRFRINKMVPVGDLRLEQSLRFENV